MFCAFFWNCGSFVVRLGNELAISGNEPPPFLALIVLWPRRFSEVTSERSSVILSGLLCDNYKNRGAVIIGFAGHGFDRRIDPRGG